jgi:indolepyruvate decarboxylase
VNNLICQLDDFLTMHKEMPLITDCGDCMFASIPLNADDVLSNSYYTSMGFAVPAALAVQIASGRRPLVLVGDGGFQMTGTEISHAPRHGLNPVVVVWNNGIWGMMKKGMPKANYIELPNWPYARLAELWGGRGFQVRTPAEFSDSLTQAYKEQRFSLLEVFLDPNDFSPTLQAYAKGVSQRSRDAARPS